jgi:thioredoxin-related protein
LSKRAQELKAKDIVIVAVQTSEIKREKLDEWKNENNISFPVGVIEGDSEKIRTNWGVRSLPWLILTDKKHTVVAEGFSIDELDDKITSLGQK